MNVKEINPRDRVQAVINLNSEDFYWLLPPDGKAEDKLIVVDALVYQTNQNDETDDNNTKFVLDGGEYGVFEAPATHMFKTTAEANAFIREQNRERAIQMLNESNTMQGLLKFLVAHDAIKMPEDPVAREVLYIHLEDAGLGNQIPMYALPHV